MKETSLMYNLNCKTQAHASVFAEGKNNAYRYNFAVKGRSKFEGSYRKSGGTIFSRMIYHSINVLVLY